MEQAGGKTVFLGGSMVGFVNDMVSLFLGLASSFFFVIANSCGGGRSAEDACDPGGGGGNKFELLDITEE